MLNLSRDIRSLSEFKRNTPDFMKQLRTTGQPVVLTINGKAELVIQTAEGYQDLLENLSLEQNQQFLQASRAQVDTGEHLPMKEFVTHLDKKKKKRS